MLNLNIEKKLWQSGYSRLGGIDEAGRGPLAGPVVAACVIFSQADKIPQFVLDSINDSKKLSLNKREKLFLEIIKIADFGIGVCDHEIIFKINILQASLLAMKKAISAIKNKPNFLLIDGRFNLPNISIKQRSFIKGDTKIFSIAAASILAKVTRDQIMKKYDKIYPWYGFEQHKGYGTKLHLEKLKKYGPCLIHRRNYAPIKKLLFSKTL